MVVFNAVLDPQTAFMEPYLSPGEREEDATECRRDAYLLGHGAASSRRDEGIRLG